jgi:CheY-like chemotaxis protein/putative methionine-R-sulfoxide reductase with GAF domain
MLEQPTRGNPRLWPMVLTALALVAVFLTDIVMPLGYAFWALYMVPVGLSLLQRRASVPFAIAAVATALAIVGYQLSPRGIQTTMAVVNRSVGVGSLWLLAVVIWQVLLTRARAERLAWLQQGEGVVTERLIGKQDLDAVAGEACAALCDYLRADTAVLYQRDDGRLRRRGGHALDLAAVPATIALGDGVAGQVASDGLPRVLADVDAAHLPVRSATGSTAARHVVVAPLTANGEVCGVVELGFLRAGAGFGEELALLRELAERIGSMLLAAHYTRKVQALLEREREQSEALQAQQEELRATNEELEEQGRILRESQARLETQQVELEQSNLQLEEHTQTLQEQRGRLLEAQREMRETALRLQAASRYKSEFLANMSHELRTPLNSALILSRLLADNKPGTLTEEQVGYARAIHSANNDLLALINDILDLSKIEAGHVEIHPADASLAELLERLRATFEPLAQQKALAFGLHVDGDVDDALHTDAQRLQQVLTNLLGNAIKFTEQGEVRLRVRRDDERLAFEVRDTGIGIAREQQDLVFEAFRQVDSGSSRRFGGTGLGLSISRELARRLGGEIRVDSEPGRGSVFTLSVPQRLQPARTLPPAAATAAADGDAAPAMAAADGDAAPVATTTAPRPRRDARPAATSRPASRAAAAEPAPLPAIERRHPDRLILAVEDDPQFAAVLCELVREMDFDCVTVASAAEALRLARELGPNGILLDVGLPDQSGLAVLERLKRDPQTRHIPVHMISLHDRAQTALELGAVGYLLKPGSREELAGAIERIQQQLQRNLRRLLIVEDDAELREHLGLLLAAEHVEITAVGRMDEALGALEARSFDCMVLDLTLPDGSGYELLETMARGERYAFPPVIVYTGRVLSRDEEQRLRRYSKSIIVKGARSPERLLDEVTLFLHSVESALPPEQQRLLRQARERDAVLEGRRILLVEDDVRNIFALSSVFEPLGAKLLIARNGREALEQLAGDEPVDLVLMDIMMPEMDGITAMRRLRENPAWATLPVIALTAKAMPDDREQCLAAGANDYVAKPIDVDKLVSLCRVWMPK